MHRKIMGIGIGAILTLSLLVIIGIAFAQESGTTPSTGFVDTDGDGVCDNAGSCPYKDESAGFVDTDGDGVCDNAGSCQMRQVNGGCGKSGGCKGGCQRHATE
jgi:hypothetical protein